MKQWHRVDKLETAAAAFIWILIGYFLALFLWRHFQYMTFSPGRRFGAESVVLVSSSGITLIFFKQMAPVSNQEKDADSGDYGEFVF